MKPKIYIDVSDLGGYALLNKRVSGIQRVVINIISQLLHNVETDYDICAVFYHKADETFYEVDESFFHPHKHYASDEIIEAFGKAAPRALNPYKYQGRPFRRLFHELRHKLRVWMHNLSTSNRYGSALRDPASFSQNDIYLFMGAGWEVPWLMHKLKNLQEKMGVKVVFFVHDLIPVFAENGRTSMHKQLFVDWLEVITPFVRNYLTCSNYTKNDLIRYIENSSFYKGSIPAVQVTPLAHEFVSNDSVVRQDKIGDLNRQEFVLFVGPIVGRKNADKIIEAWIKLIKVVPSDRMPKLVLAGNQKGGEKYLNYLNQDHPEIVRYLVFLHNPNDAELEWLYQNCLFSCFPSLYEGWGLPVGESLWFGRYCITSTASSLPEVGGEFVDLVNLDEEGSLYRALERPLLDRVYLKDRNSKINRSDLRSWKQTAEDILHKISRI